MSMYAYLLDPSAAQLGSIWARPGKFPVRVQGQVHCCLNAFCMMTILSLVRPWVMKSLRRRPACGFYCLRSLNGQCGQEDEDAMDCDAEAGGQG